MSELASPAATEVICGCVPVTLGALQKAIDGGCRSFAQLQQATRCGSVCNSCVPAVVELLGENMWVWADVVATAPESPGILSIELVPRTPGYPQPLPGQHLIVEGRVDGALQRRSYTISSARRSERLRITVKREDRGLFSRWLVDGYVDFTTAREKRAVGGGSSGFADGGGRAEPPLNDGKGTTEPLRITSPLGSFAMDPAGGAVVCLVAGIGVTPALALVRTLADEALALPVCVHYSGKTRPQMAGLKELEAAAQQRPNLQLIVRETSVSGRLSAEEVTALVQQNPQAEYFLCGPTSYLEQIGRQLRAAGVPDARVHSEIFLSSRAPAEPKVPAAELAGSQRYMLVPPTPVPMPWPKRLLRRFGTLISQAVNSPQADLRVAGVRLNPLHLAERMLAQRAGIDPALPYEYLALVGDLAEGNLLHQTHYFASLDPLAARSRAAALEARSQGLPLPQNTPDGNTFTYAMPALKLVEMPKECAVDTGWTRSAPGNVVPVYVLRGRIAIDHVLRRAETIDRGALPYYYLQQVMGRRDIKTCPGRQAAGLGSGTYRNNSTWSHDRQAATKLFGLPVLDQIGPMMAAALPSIYAVIDDAIAREPEAVFDLNVLTSKIAYTMIIRVIFGNVDLAEFHALGQKLTESIRRLFDYTIQLTYGRQTVPTDYAYHNLRVRTTCREMIQLLRDLESRGQLTERQRAVPTVRMVLDSAPDGADDEQLVTLFMPFIFGGHETTGHSLCWALYELGRSRALEATVVTEIDEFHSRHRGEPIGRDQYDERPISFALLAETLRCHVLSGSISRMSLKAGVVPPEPDTGIGSFAYPEGSFFLVSPVGVHRDPQRWSAPAEFRIDRFLVGTAAGQSVVERGRRVQKTIRAREEALDLMSFGHGPARCPGVYFNFHESLLVLDGLLSRYRFELEHPEREVGPSESPLIGPEYGMVGVRIRSRHHQPATTAF